MLGCFPNNLCMSPTATVPSMARHYLTEGNALT